MWRLRTATGCITRIRSFLADSGRAISGREACSVSDPKRSRPYLRSWLETPHAPGCSGQTPLCPRRPPLLLHSTDAIRRLLPYCMFDHLAARHIDNLFADISHVVCYTLEVFQDKGPLYSLLDQRGLCSHGPNQFDVGAIIEQVHFVVAFDGCPRLFRVTGGECIESLNKHILDDGGHARQIDVELKSRLLVQ